MTLIEIVERFALALEQAQVSTGQGTLEFWDEAAWLVLWQLKLPLESDLHQLSSTPPYNDLTASTRQLLEQIIEHRIQSRQPSAYLTHEAWLQGLSFYVDERVIIPRSHIAEILVQETLSAWLKHEPTRILDLCTGNGSLAIFCAKIWPQAHIQGLDISKDALDVARINETRHHLSRPIEWLQSDGLERATGPYDLVVCNPPYVPQSSMQLLPKEFQAEPSLALDGGEDGMDFIARVLPHMSSLMSKGAILVLEIGHEIQAFTSLYPQLQWMTLPTQASEQEVLMIGQEELQRYFMDHPTPTRARTPGS